MSADQIREIVPWTDPRLKTITRILLVGPAGFGWLTVEGVWGVLDNGDPVAVQVPFETVPRKHYYGAMLDWARREGVYLDGLGVFGGTVVTVLNERRKIPRTRN